MSMVFSAVLILRVAAQEDSVQNISPSKPAATSREQLRNLNLPEHFAQITGVRLVIDRYHEKHYRVAAGATPVPQLSVTVRNPTGRGVRVVQPPLLPEAIDLRNQLTNRFVPARSFRAPILDLTSECSPAGAGADVPTERDRAATEQITRRLAHDGLISTLAQVLKILGPEHFLRANSNSVERLRCVGFPVDLLAWFEMNGSHSEDEDEAERLIGEVAEILSAGGSPNLRQISFHFRKTEPAFQVATESGEHELGLFRLQAGGGYDGGIVPGGSIDVISQLVSSFPEADFIIGVPSEMLLPLHSFAKVAWRLRRADQVTLVAEPLKVTPWVQDNGKAGLVKDQPAGSERLATLAPRYASVDEGVSTFVPGDSFVMEGLKAAGHRVIHSPLLFQGGNLLPIRDPKSGERILLVGEGELYRNMALGLTREQSVEAFRVEFRVDRCVVLSAVSYHLDYDVCVRAHEGELFAFVNDTLAAARLIVELGLKALERHGALNAAGASQARAQLEQKRDAELVQRIRKILPSASDSRSDFLTALAPFFVSGKTDLAAGNLQTFLLAIDLLESSTLAEPFDGMDSERAEYLRALKRIEAARSRQVDELKKLRLKLVPVPSMPDMGRGINYINGIHHRHGYIMPAFGGFYAPLDHAAAKQFTERLGPNFRLTLIQSAESQRLFGGVHCTAAAYPRL